jgi:hypothetical protein
VSNADLVTWLVIGLAATVELIKIVALTTAILFVCWCVGKVLREIDGFDKIEPRE